MNTKRILIIEDDADAANVLEAYLHHENFEVTVNGDELKGLDMVKRWKPDLVLLDVMLPGMNGMEVLAAIRRAGDTPVIMVTEMGDVYDKIGTLRYGADDYVVKPYIPEEIITCVQAVLRRVAYYGLRETQLRWGGLDVETMSVTVTNASGQLSRPHLTSTEFNLLTTLMRAPTRPLSRQHLFKQYLPDSEALKRVVDTHIFNLRKNWSRRASIIFYLTFEAWVKGSDNNE